MPVGLVGVYRGATGIDCWTPPEGTRSRPDLRDLAEWKPVANENWTKANVKGAINRADQQPAVYWNTVVAPWAPFACRGMLWYQGEHDSGEPQRYCSKLHALYDGWRGRFENRDLRFYFVQLCSWGSNIAPMQEAMALLRANQGAFVRQAGRKGLSHGRYSGDDAGERRQARSPLQRPPGSRRRLLGGRRRDRARGLTYAELDCVFRVEPFDGSPFEWHEYVVLLAERGVDIDRA